jgi:hypothetical protein
VVSRRNPSSHTSVVSSIPPSDSDDVHAHTADDQGRPKNSALTFQ